jgi:PIN domain nuclease of toxin-antitoxin system
MATKFIVDTHALVWHLEGNRALGKQAKAVIDSPQSDLILPIIALAEAAYIVEKGRFIR